MPLAAEDFEDLIDSMGLAGTAASNLDEILRRLSAATLAEEAAMRVAAGTGQTVAQVKAALSAANKAAADAERALAAELKTSTDAAIAAAQATAKLASERAKAAENAQKAAAKSDVDAFRERQRMAENEKGFARQRAETSQWFTDIRKGGGESAASLDDIKASVAGVTAEYAAAIAIVTAYATALYTLAAAAITLTQEKDAIRATFDAFTGGGGADLLDGLEGLAARLPYTADKLNAWAESLLGAGIEGERLKTRIEAIGASAAIMTKDGGRSAEGLFKKLQAIADSGGKVQLDKKFIRQLQETGARLEDIAKQLGVTPEKLKTMTLTAEQLGDALQNALIAKGTKPLAAMGQTWASITAKMSEGWEDAFEDLGEIVNPFMAQLRSLASEFFAGSAASKGLSGAVRGVLAPAFEIATRTIRAAHIAYLNMLIAYLQARIFFAPLIDALNKLGVSGGVVNVAMYLIAGAAIVLAVVLGALALAVFLLALPFILAAVAIYGVVQAVKKLIALVGGAVASMDSIKGKAQEMSDGIAASVSSMLSRTATSLAQFPLTAATAGANFVLGLVQAITSGQGPVADAVKNLAKSALAAITGSGGFDSHSPSRKAHKVGTTVPSGLVVAFEEGEEDVEEAASGVAGAAMGGVNRGMRKGGRSGKGGRGMLAETINIYFNGPAEDFPGFREQAEKWLEELGASGPEPEPA